MNEEQLVDWNPLDEKVLADQNRAYDEMRERCPVAYSELMGWSLFRHEDIVSVLADTESFSNASQFLAIPNGMDPPTHARYREALEPNFNQQQMGKFEPYARAIAASLLGDLSSSEEVEFIEAFVTPFALKSLCALLAWPEEQWECLSGWVHGSQQAAFNKDPIAGKDLATLFLDHVKANLEKHRASTKGGANATNTLLNTEIDSVRLDDEQIVSILRNWTAGHGTVAAGLGIVILHLAQEIDLQNSLRNNPSLIPAAIEEILRVDGPLVANPRTSTREVNIQDQSIPEGEHLTLMWLAANRDSRVFDAAAVINIERNMNDSLVWGQGIHLCQGAPLARLEMRVAIEELLSGTKHFALAKDSVPTRAVYPGNGLAALLLQYN